MDLHPLDIMSIFLNIPRSIPNGWICKCSTYSVVYFSCSLFFLFPLLNTILSSSTSSQCTRVKTVWKILQSGKETLITFGYPLFGCYKSVPQNTVFSETALLGFNDKSDCPFPNSYLSQVQCGNWAWTQSSEW